MGLPTCRFGLVFKPIKYEAVWEPPNVFKNYKHSLEKFKYRSFFSLLYYYMFNLRVKYLFVYICSLLISEKSYSSTALFEKLRFHGNIVNIISHLIVMD